MRSFDLRYQNPNDPAIATYIVPCVVKAVCMVEILRKSQTGLRVEDLRSMTGYSKSTIYRILRSLTWCEYLFRDAGGFYRLNHDVITIAQENTYPGA
jgi:DNA-binding IclR family transcriptional regulator